LIKQLKTSQHIEDIFMNTRNTVEHLSEGLQRPQGRSKAEGCARDCSALLLWKKWPKEIGLPFKKMKRVDAL
jgi:hypothetical protein